MESLLDADEDSACFKIDKCCTENILWRIAKDYGKASDRNTKEKQDHESSESSSSSESSVSNIDPSAKEAQPENQMDVDDPYTTQHDPSSQQPEPTGSGCSYFPTTNHPCPNALGLCPIRFPELAQPITKPNRNRLALRQPRIAEQPPSLDIRNPPMSSPGTIYQPPRSFGIRNPPMSTPGTIYQPRSH